MTFTPLHLHTEYSLLDGLGKINDYIVRAKESGIESMAITDHGVLYGAYEWQDRLKKAGLKGIIGMEGYLASGSIYDKNRRAYHLLLLAENNVGYKNLLKLSSRAFTEGFYYNARFDLDMLAEHSEGLIATSACLGGPIARNLLDGNEERAIWYATRLTEIFGKERFFLEIQDHTMEDQRKTNQPMIHMAERMGIGVVATNDTHYVDKKDAPSQDLLMCISTRSVLSSPNRMRSHSSEGYLKSPKEMLDLFRDYRPAITNTNKIAEMCNVDLSWKGYHLPKFNLPEGQYVTGYLESLVREGARRKYGYVGENIQQRIDYELGIINSMGFGSYFLIVWDFVRFARDNNILVGAGRGSAAGSIVAYCLGITSICPLKYDLIFERFLMPGRIGMPDIDIDFDSTRRQEVIDYVVKTYGDDRVAQMATFGTLTARAAIRDTGRALGLPYPTVEQVSKLIPATVNMNLTLALNIVPELKALYDSESEVRNMFDSALKIEGVARHASTHAAGIVISRDPLIDHVPVQKIGKKTDIVTQYSADSLEKIGLLKMDFLGLKILTVLELAQQQIRQHTPDFDVDRLPEDDEKTFAMLQRGETSGVFQLEGNMNTFLIKANAPSCINDIVAQIALSRPGPRDLAFEYIERKHGRSEVVYDHPLMEEALKDTYGVMVYQEQVIRIANTMAGFTLTEGEGLRKAISKKKFEEINVYRETFIDGCIKNGVPHDVAEKVFNQIERHGWYSLNKSHSAAYGYIGYQTAYVKANYPAEFMSAWLTTEVNDNAEVGRIIAEAKRMGIPVLPPDINRSKRDFVVDRIDNKDSIRYGLVAIRGVGEKAAASILETRNVMENGVYPDLFTLCQEIDWKLSNKKTIENMAKCGAFDCFGPRAQIMASLDAAIHSGQNDQKIRKRGQIRLFDMDEEVNKAINSLRMDYSEISQETMLMWEKETIGVYLGVHPLDYLESYIRENNFVLINELPDYENGEIVHIIGILESNRSLTTKAGLSMAVSVIGDKTGSIEMVIFPQTYEKCKKVLEENVILHVIAKMDTREGKFQLICEKLEANYPKPIRYVHINLEDDTSPEKMRNVTSTLSDFFGDAPVVIHYLGKTMISKKYTILADVTTLRILSSLIGESNVSISENPKLRY